ncbi:MAG: GNAT family N-acetyltransferase [Acidimicrobiales bacterium]
MRWLYPDARQYLAHFPRFIQAFGGNAFSAQTAWILGDCSAVALWLPAGTDQDGDAIAAVVAETVAPEKLEDILLVGLQVDEAHPEFAHWYLPFFGVDGALQGKGLGGELMKHCLASVDTSHLPAYLETSNPRNIPFYERHGFEVTGRAQAGACPPVAFMLRAAQ